MNGPSQYLVFAAFLIGLTACEDSNGAPASGIAIADGKESISESVSEAIDISAIEISKRTVVEPVVGTGTMLAARTSSIGPMVDGVIEEIFVRVGDRVEKGAPLFRTRQTDLLIQEKELEAAFKLASAESRQTAREQKRSAGLRKKGIVSTAKLDEVTARNEIASARRDMAGAALDAIKQKLKDTMAVAPYKGVITQRMVDEGVFLSNRMSGFGNSAVLELQQIDIVVAVVHIPEKYLPQLSVGTKGRLFIDGIAEPIDTEIHIINDKIDIESRAIDVRLGYQNKDYAIKPGLFVRAEIYPEPREVILIERRAVRGSINNPHVFVRDSGVARQRPVSLIDHDASYFEVLTGLDEGDTILVGPNLPRVRDGSQLRLVQSSVAS